MDSPSDHDCSSVGMAKAIHASTPSDTYTHPSYSHPTADLELVSDDGVHFKTHSIILKYGSEFFRSMLDVPQNPLQDDNEPIRFSEPSEVLLDLLNIIYPNADPFPQILTFKHCCNLYTAAEKYDMAKVKAVVRKLVQMPEMGAKESPLELYVLACRFGWDEEKMLALTWSLEYDIHTPASVNILANLDAAKDLLYIQILHRSRRRYLEERIKIAIAPHLSSVLRQGYTAHIISECLDTCPSGKQLGKEEFWKIDIADYHKCTGKGGWEYGKWPLCDKVVVAAACEKILQDLSTIAFEELIRGET